MHVTLLDVCRRARLSTATVSRVINGSDAVREKTRARVMRAVQELGYRPSHAARSLARQRTDAIGVIFPQIASGFFTEVLRGIDQVAAKRGFHLMTAFSHGQNDEHELMMRVVRERRVDALILMNLSLPDSLIKRASQSGMRLVLIDRPVAMPNLFAVSMDNVSGAEAAMAHLRDHGYREIAIITGPKNNYDAEQRFLGCKRAAARAGLTLSNALIWHGEFTEESGRAVMEDWLAKGHPLPEAIFATNDVMALGALAVLSEHGHRVPQDVALVGFDDTESARHLDLTSVRVPMSEMGMAAAEAAIRRKLGKKIERHSVLPTELIIRRSCGCKHSDRHGKNGG